MDHIVTNLILSANTIFKQKINQCSKEAFCKRDEIMYLECLTILTR